MKSLASKAKHVSAWVWIGISGVVLVTILMIVLWQVGIFSSSSSAAPTNDPFANVVSTFGTPVETKQTDVHSQIALHTNRRSHVTSSTSDMALSYRLSSGTRTGALSLLANDSDVFTYASCFNKSGSWQATLVQYRVSPFDYAVRFFRTNDPAKTLTTNLNLSSATFPVRPSIYFDDTDAVWVGIRVATAFVLNKFKFDGTAWNRTTETTQTSMDMLDFSTNTQLFLTGTTVSPYVRTGATWEFKSNLSTNATNGILTNNGQLALVMNRGGDLTSVVPQAFVKDTNGTFQSLTAATAISPGNVNTLIFASLSNSPYFAVLYLGASPSTNATVTLYRVPSLKTGGVDTSFVSNTADTMLILKKWTLNSFATSTGTLTMYYSTQNGLDIAGTLQSGAVTTTFTINASEATSV